MHKHKRLQELELSYCIVCCPCCLLTLLTCYSYSHMSLHYHVHVVSSISHCKSHFIWEFMLNHVHDVGFLFRRYSTSQNYIRD
jgi:hypothetical protein